ncbi:MAG: LamB/YcsF family protein [Albidovulum sp.]|nr:LamB/YcsF family protein [Albidovulum sp.]
MRIDLNSDLGEGFGPWKIGDDDRMLDIVTSANVACGFHAGDPDIMYSMAVRAKTKRVAVGAHPGYRDLIGFGRRAMAGITGREIERLVAYQVGAFQSVCSLAGYRMSYVKTHGALGNACNDDDGLADAVARGISAADPGLAWLIMPGTPTERAAERAGLRPAREIYADRTYADSFNLAPRSRPGTVIHDASIACERVLKMVSEGRIESETGREMKVEIDSICVHGDNPASVEMASRIRAALEAEGWTVAPFAK